MKKILTLIISALVISGSSAFAWVGGLGLIIATADYYWNLSGCNVHDQRSWSCPFSDDTTSAFSQVNSSVIFHQGTVYVGQCFGTADRTSEKVLDQ